MARATRVHSTPPKRTSKKPAKKRSAKRSPKRASHGGTVLSGLLPGASSGAGFANRCEARTIFKHYLPTSRRRGNKRCYGSPAPRKDVEDLRSMVCVHDA